jgi:hypothetical protein
MKLDFLSPAQWSSLLNMHSDAARMLGRGFIRCGNCARRENLTPRTAEQYLRQGWPICCEGTLQGGTMNYYASEENLRKELARGD